MAQNVTIRDVARAAGVSKSLVSLVLRGDPGVSETRRRAVLDAVESLGYRPNHAARALSTARTGIVGVLLDDLRNPWFVDLLEGLTSTLRGAALTPLLLDATLVRHSGGDPLTALTSVGVDGLVVVGSTAEGEALAEVSTWIPTVLAGTRTPRLPHVDTTSDDDEAGGRLAAEHLIALGHRRIGHLRAQGEVGDKRFAGFRRALEAAGLDASRWVVAGGTSEEAGYTATRRLLTSPGPPTALFAYNDVAAVGALSAAADLGVRVPDDLSVVGFDNTHLARIRHISLTTVDFGSYAVGVQAARFLIERMGNPGLPARSSEVSTTLTVRGTTGLAPGTAD